MILLVFGLSWRLKISAGDEYLEAALREKKPVILTFWHNRSFPGTRFVSGLLRRGFKILVLASLSRDGELVSRLGKLWGLTVVRGSTSRGGLGAMRAIYRAVKNEGFSPAMLPDGPRGPVYEMKMGVVVLAQMTQTSILPVGMAAQRFSTLKSWDRMIVPWPLTKIDVVVGEPQHIAKGLSSEELELERQRIQTQIRDLTRRAEERLGVEDVV